MLQQRFSPPAYCTPVVAWSRPRAVATGAGLLARAAQRHRVARHARPSVRANGAKGSRKDGRMGEAVVETTDEAREENGGGNTVSLPPTHILTVVGDDASSLANSLERISSAVDRAGGQLITGFHALSVSAAEASVHVPTTDVGRVLQQSLDRAVGMQPNGDDGEDADTRRVRQGLAIQPHKTARMAKRLALFDLDGTLITEEGIDELAAEAGPDVQAAVCEVTARAMRGELDFRDALAERVALLEGLDVGRVIAVRDRVTVTQGAYELVSALRRTGCVPVLVSGGFSSIARRVADEVGISHVFANELEVDESGKKLTGRVVGEMVDAEFKRDTLLEFAERLGASRDEILVVGDGANDVLMMEEAGLSVAFNGKAVAQDTAVCSLNGPSLAPILYVLGMSDANIESLSTIPI